MNERLKAGEIIGVDDDGPIVVVYFSKYPKEMMMAKEETILGKVLGLLTRMISSKLVLNDLARAEIYEITNYALSNIGAGQARQELRKRREEAFGRLDEVRADAELQAEMVAKILAKVVR